MARRVQEIVREGSQRSLSGLQPIEIARGMAAQPQHLLNLLHVGALIGAARTPKAFVGDRRACVVTSSPRRIQVPALWMLGWAVFTRLNMYTTIFTYQLTIALAAHKSPVWRKCCWSLTSLNAVGALPAVARRAEPGGAQNPEGSTEEVRPCVLSHHCPRIASSRAPSWCTKGSSRVSSWVVCSH